MNMKPKLQRAGGFNACDGHPVLFRRAWPTQLRPWRIAVKKLLTQLQQTDPRIDEMVTSATTEWLTYEQPAYSQWTSLTPLQKQQALFAWIFNQKTPTGKSWSVLEILSAGLAGLLWWEHHVQPRHDAYTRAVDCARAVRFLLRTERRYYESDDGHGMVRKREVWINQHVQIRSRNAAQKIEAEIQKHAGWLLRDYREALQKALRDASLIG